MIARSLAPAASIDFARLQRAAGEATALLRVMANRDRLMLLCLLVEGERCVGELEAATGIRQPSLSQQLGVLRDEGLVQTRRDGKFIHYRLASSHVLPLLEVLHARFCPPPRRRGTAVKVSA